MHRALSLSIHHRRDTLTTMRLRIPAAIAATVVLGAVLAGCTSPEPEPSPTESVDPRAVSSDFEVDDDGLVMPGSGVTVGTTVPTLFADSAGSWDIDLTITEITEGDPADLSVVTASSTDLTGLVPYYTTITVTVTGDTEGIAGKTLGGLFSYTTEAGALAPRLVSINGAFPACTGSDAFPAAPAADATPDVVEKSKTITFCQVSLGSASDPVDQVNWQPVDTQYSAEDGNPVFFREG